MTSHAGLRDYLAFIVWNKLSLLELNIMNVVRGQLAQVSTEVVVAFVAVIAVVVVASLQC